MQAKVRVNNTFLEFDDDDDTDLLGCYSKSCIARIGPEVVDPIMDDNIHKDEDSTDAGSSMPEEAPFQRTDEDPKQDFLDTDSPGVFGSSMMDQCPVNQSPGPWGPKVAYILPYMVTGLGQPYPSGPYPSCPEAIGGMPPMPQWVPAMQFPMANQRRQPHGFEGISPYHVGQQGHGTQDQQAHGRKDGFGQECGKIDSDSTWSYQSKKCAGLDHDRSSSSFFTQSGCKGFGNGKGFGKGKSKTGGSGAWSKNFDPEEAAQIYEFERSIGIVREDASDQGKTTVMFQNIPNKFSQKMLLNEIDSRGFKGKYDFFYLPIDFNNRCNVGYAFLNFINEAWAKKFQQELTGVKLSSYGSRKICAVVPARIQGLQKNIAAYRNSPVIGIPVESYKPLIFENGIQVPFPEPEVALPSVQLRNPKTFQN